MLQRATLAVSIMTTHVTFDPKQDVGSDSTSASLEGEKSSKTNAVWTYHSFSPHYSLQDTVTDELALFCPWWKLIRRTLTRPLNATPRTNPLCKAETTFPAWRDIF